MGKFSPEQIKKIKEIGSYLSSQRLKKSISLEKIVSDTLIRREILEAMEMGEIERLPELVYLQGFIRRYADAIEVDGESLVKKLNSTNNTVTVKTAGIQSAITSKLRALRKIGVYLIYLFLFAGALYGLSFLLKLFPRRLPGKQPSSPVVTNSVSPSTTDTNPKFKSSLTPTPKPTTTPTSSPQVLSVTVNLEEASWMRIKVDGKTEFEGILNKGSQKTWQAKKQLLIRVGNAGAVKLSKNGEPPAFLGNPGEVKEINLTR